MVAKKVEIQDLARQALCSPSRTSRNCNANGISIPIHAAASTSVGQCTPSTNRDHPTKSTQSKAITRMSLTLSGQIGLRHRVKAMAKQVVSNVCPLGKLVPQYHRVSHNAGRSLPVRSFST